MKPVWSAGIEQEFEQITNVRILAGYANVKVFIQTLSFKEEKEGAKDKSNGMSGLFSRKSK
jgi:hypothetical protein